MPPSRNNQVRALAALMAGLVLFARPGSDILAQNAPMSLRQKERLGRGLVAIPRENGDVFLSWRLLGTDSGDIAFNVYRATGDGLPSTRMRYRHQLGRGQ
jgi:rhamnogalacturonan endolyase